MQPALAQPVFVKAKKAPPAVGEDPEPCLPGPRACAALTIPYPIYLLFYTLSLMSDLMSINQMGKNDV